MCQYCSESIEFRERGPFSGLKQIKMVYPCDRCAGEPKTVDRFHAADEPCPKQATT